MLGRRGRGQANRQLHEATVWIDHDQAIIVDRAEDGAETVETLERRPAETAALFEARTVEQVVDETRVVVSGPADMRTEFDRAYVAVTHRPDRLVDVEPTRPSQLRAGRQA